jgi:hypothetical protein
VEHEIDDLEELLAEFPKPVAELARRTVDVVMDTVGDDAFARVQLAGRRSRSARASARRTCASPSCRSAPIA